MLKNSMGNVDLVCHLQERYSPDIADLIKKIKTFWGIGIYDTPKCNCTQFAYFLFLIGHSLIFTFRNRVLNTPAFKCFIFQIYLWQILRLLALQSKEIGNLRITA